MLPQNYQDRSINGEAGISPARKYCGKVTALAEAINLAHSKKQGIYSDLIPVYIHDKIIKGEKPPRQYEQIIETCNLCARLAKIYEKNQAN